MPDYTLSPMCITKYCGPTNHRGARIKVTLPTRSYYVGWDYSLNPSDNHAAAAHCFLGHDRTIYGGCFKGGEYHWVSPLGVAKFNAACAIG